MLQDGKSRHNRNASGPTCSGQIMALTRPRATVLNLADFLKKSVAGSRHAQTTKGGWGKFCALFDSGQAAVVRYCRLNRAAFNVSNTYEYYYLLIT